MLKLIWPLILLITNVALAQDLSQDLEFIETQNTQSNAFNMPLYVDLDGNLSLITKSPDASMSVGPFGTFFI